jgi:hypothetical protein
MTIELPLTLLNKQGRENMALRTEKLLQMIEPVIKEREPQLQEKLAAVFEQSKGAFGESLLRAIECCESDAKAMRDTGRKGETALACISFLISSAMNGEWALLVSLHDERGFVDEAECAAEVSYAPLGQVFEQEVALYGKYIAPNVAPNIRPYEMDALKQELLHLLYDWVGAYLIRLFRDMGFIAGFEGLSLPQLAEVSYGYLLNDQHTIFSIMRGEEE